MDDVPIPLRPAFESPHPSDFEVLTKIETASEGYFVESAVSVKMNLNDQAPNDAKNR